MTRPAGILWASIVLFTAWMMIVVDPSCSGGVSNEECIACHRQADLRSRRGKSRFIDSVRFAESAHSKNGLGCISCHQGITVISRESRIPHGKGREPDCGRCHPEVVKEYSKSAHARVSKQICYSCHNLHYCISFREMSGEERKNICLKCHDASRTHRWLPQKELHFNHLECTSCHALKADIGLIFSMVDKSETAKEKPLHYDQLELFTKTGTSRLIETLDQDGNGEVSSSELGAFMNRLRENGIPEAALEARILVLKPTHDFTSKGEQTRDCTLCHSRDAKFYSHVLLLVPEKEGGYSTVPVARGIPTRFGQRPVMDDFYLIGGSKIRKEDIEDVLAAVKRIGFKWLDLLGAFIILGSVTSVSFHGMLMFLTRKLRRPPPTTEDADLRPLPVRAWHWLHGLFVILLVLTGIHLRLPNLAPIFATFLSAVNLHNLAGAVVLFDYIFWISYHLWKKDFKSRFLISSKGFFRDAAGTIHYYWYLIFVGKDHPVSTGPHLIYDPVERLFFCLTMLLLLPAQIVTGALLYDVRTAMPAISALGGLRVIDAIHLVCAYLLVSSMVVHVYFHMLKKYRRVTR